MCIKINKQDLKIFLMIFSFMEPWWFSQNFIIDKIFDLVKLYICFGIIVNLTKNKIKMGGISKLIFCFRCYICIVTVVRGLPVLGYLSESIQYVCFIILLEHLLQCYGVRLVKIVSVSFAVILVLNVITYTPGGIIFEPSSGYYLLGIRTRIAEVAFPAIGIALYNFKITKKHKILFWTVFSSALIFFILQWVATALTCLLILVVLLAIEKIIYKKYKNVYHWALLIVIVCVSLGVVFFHIQEIFAGLIEVFLHKQASLTGRTDLWDIAMKVVKEEWIFGHGFQEQGNFVAMYEFITTSHNQWLQTMYYGGVVGSVMYYSIPLLAIKNSMFRSKQQFNRYASILIITLFTIIFMCTTEIVMDNIYYFILVTILNFSGKLEQGETYSLIP